MKRSSLLIALLVLTAFFYVTLGGQEGCPPTCTDLDGDGFAIEGGECGPIDCDDTDPDVNPGAIEGPEGDRSCFDGLDNDCDGLTDDGGDPDCGAFRPLPDTGTELCYDNNIVIPCPAPGEPFYGQDANYTTNPMSYADNGNGTVTDYVTGLMWQQTDDGTVRTWDAAVSYCEVLGLAGYADWRLPDEYELQSILDYGHLFPYINETFFPGTPPSHYWAVNEYAENFDWAWEVHFGEAFLTPKLKSDNSYARCVRGETMAPFFTDNGDGTVTDNVTGLMWQQEDDDTMRGWEGALAYCEGLELAGHADWLLPDIKELGSITDYTITTPAIDEVYFPGTNDWFYWSSTTHFGGNPVAWQVYYEVGYLIYDFKEEGEVFGRCVRH